MSSPTHRFDPELGHVQREGLRLSRRNEAGETIRVIGSRYGIRQPPVEYRTHGTDTVLVLGDSFTAGTQVVFRDTWVGRLQDHFNSRFPSLQWINGGVDGYDLSQSYRLGQRLARTFSVRHIVLALYVGNDIRDYERDANARPPWARSGVRTWLREHTYLFHLWRGAQQRLLAEEGDDDSPPRMDLSHWQPHSVTGYEQLSPREKHRVRDQFASADLLPVLRGGEESRRCLEATERMIEAFADWAASRCATFTLVLIPLKQQAIPPQRAEWKELHHLSETDALAPQNAFTAWTRGHDVVAVDTTSALASDPSPERLYWRINMHMSTEGHRVVADVLTPVFESQLTQTPSNCR